MKKPRFLFILLALAIGLAACQENATTYEQDAPETHSGMASSAHPDELIILTQAKAEIGRISHSGTIQNLQFGGQKLEGRLKGDKRKYANSSGTLVAEVKSSDANGFKLRNPDGSLRWKVKLYEDKVKISDNEENERPWQIKTSDDKFKVKDADEQEIGRIEQEGESVFVTSDQLQFVLQAPYRLSYGVLLIPALSLQDQMILLAELMDRGY